ncbi:MAG: hypothetical protein HRU34_12745 [Richelia sp.]|nr:hypothetical protein [Richelia sp.]
MLAVGLFLSSLSLLANAQVLAQTSSKQVKVPKLDAPGRRESGGTRTPVKICITGKVPLLILLRSC